MLMLKNPATINSKTTKRNRIMAICQSIKAGHFSGEASLSARIFTVALRDFQAEDSAEPGLES